MRDLISTKKFSPEDLRKWQLKLLDILFYFRDFCETNNLRFYLAAGTSIIMDLNSKEYYGSLGDQECTCVRSGGGCSGTIGYVPVSERETAAPLFCLDLLTRWG